MSFELIFTIKYNFSRAQDYLQDSFKVFHKCENIYNIITINLRYWAILLVLDVSYLREQILGLICAERDLIESVEIRVL